MYFASEQFGTNFDISFRKIEKSISLKNRKRFRSSRGMTLHQISLQAVKAQLIELIPHLLNFKRNDFKLRILKLRQE